MKDNPIKGRALVVARTIPKESGGTMIVIRRLLDNFGGDEVIVMGRSPYKPAVLGNDKPLHYPVVEIPFPYWKGFRFWRLLSIPLGVALGIWTVLTKNIKVIVGVYPDMGSLSVAYFISVLTGRPLLPYFCDLYAENQKGGLHGKWAKWLQPKVFQRAVSVLAANDGMKEFYEKSYGIKVISLPTAINGEFPEKFELPAFKKPFIIGYSGSVVLDRLDPMQAMVQAVGDNPDYELRLFTPQKQDFLQKNGIWASNVKLRFCASQQELMNELGQCHLLYLPLTFKTGPGFNSVEQLATCFGIKSYEYFLSARPVLSHCPPSYFTSRFFEMNNCGFTLGQITVEEIRNTLEHIKASYLSQGRDYAGNAIKTATKFKGKALATEFTKALNEAIDKH